MKIPSLSARIALLVGVATVVIVGAAAVIMDQMVDAEMGRRFDDSLLSQSRALTALVNTDTSRLPFDPTGPRSSRLLTGQPSASYIIRCDNGSAARSDPSPANYPPNWMQSARGAPEFADIETGGRTLRAVWFRLGPQANGQPGSPTPTAVTARLTR